MRDALQCKTQVEWIKRFPKTFYSARENGFYKECAKHFIRLKRKPDDI